jgi:type IV pilus assembly protein PilA
MKQLRLRNESGFTLIELLVVVAIIGILAAIAIPQFAAYRKRGHEAQVKSDLRNAAVAQEAYFAANSAYKAANPLTGSVVQGFNATTGVTVVATAGNNTFELTARHANCASDTWTFSSVTGQITGGPCQ